MRKLPPTFAALLMAILWTSCARTTSEAVYPVSGSVRYKGQPASGARIAFHPLNPSPANRPVPWATVAADGSFRLSTYLQGDGAPPGRYAVTILWPSEDRKDEDGTAAGPDRLQGRYADPKTTPFQVEVRAQPNALEPFDLK